MVISVAKIFALVFIMQFHAFYVSVCEIYHNPKTHSLEISMKIFMDDLELAIQKSGKSDYKLPEISGDKDFEKVFEKYLSDKLIIDINSKKVDMKLIGYEVENDAMICYIEVEKVKSIQTIQIQNTIICETYEDQINLTHFQYNDQLKSIKTTKANPEGTIDCTDW